MALLGTDNTTVALRQPRKARVTVTLVETLVGFAIAMDAVDHTVELQLQLPAQILVQGNFLLVQPQGIRHRVGKRGLHLANGTYRH
jgi:hypothetical protein